MESAISEVTFKIQESAIHSGQCDWKLQSVGIGTGEVMESGKWIRSDSGKMVNETNSGMIGRRLTDSTSNY